MSRLLYIESSPRKKRSASIEVSQTFLNQYKKTHADDEVITLDLWHKDIPTFDGDIIDSKYAIMHGQSHTEAQRKAWRTVEQTIAEFKNADKYVFSIPMWNFSIPYKLKHYIDVIVQPSYTFTFSPTEGYKGLVVNKPAVLIYARGGAYGSGTGAESLDLQKSYMETILKFIGFTDIRSIVIEPTLGGGEVMEKAKEQAMEMAAHF
ncbi:FMN-dependent NADH-azoreductase [Candidatus Protochlamydia phocaeensis]|uniref:FMN-dependent NADH-azoreductase n=1 Tax=Candidatus Protochlamydia phocaeensis TaxID=1414722 RepID=UPI0008381656|nr:NAD(P)H-dependent oxidoreductase [Candidatus Protochlamydia phocaeensis]